MQNSMRNTLLLRPHERGGAGHDLTGLEYLLIRISFGSERDLFGSQNYEGMSEGFYCPALKARMTGLLVLYVIVLITYRSL
jgi:hypothetical protein